MPWPDGPAAAADARLRAGIGYEAGHQEIDAMVSAITDMMTVLRPPTRPARPSSIHATRAPPHLQPGPENDKGPNGTQAIMHETVAVHSVGTREPPTNAPQHACTADATVNLASYRSAPHGLAGAPYLPVRSAASRQDRPGLRSDRVLAPPAEGRDA
jgi:hypothetical protein